MKRAKRIAGVNTLKGVAALCVAGALAFSLAGCAGNTGSQEGSQAQSSASSSSSDSSSEVVTYANIEGMNFEYTEHDKRDSYDESTATKISVSGSLESASISGKGASVNGSVLEVNKEGTYILSGGISDGQVRVNVGDNEKVQLVLADIKIHNNSGSAIFIKNADKCFITLAAGTENTLTDGDGYTFEEGEDEPNATLFSKDDLTINGKGTLNVNGVYKHAVFSKDDLVITGGTFNVNSTEDGLKGKDSIRILDGTFNVRSGEDCIKSNRDNDPTKGYVSIDGGTFNLEAGDDAIHGETYLRVESGTINISKCNEGLEAMVVAIDGGDINVNAEDDALNASAPSNSSNSNKDTFKPGEPPSGSESDDFNGEPPAGKGDNSDMRDANRMSENAPDGENANFGNRGFGKGMGFGGGMDAGNQNCKLYINGGNIVLNAKGDAIDSNGIAEINGGTLYVTGPTSNGNGALDYALSANCNGGTIIIVGSAGMAQNFSGGTQPFAFSYTSGQAGQQVSIVSESGETLASYTPTSPFETVLVSCPSFTEGGTYKLLVGDSETSITASTTPSAEMRGFGGGSKRSDMPNGEFTPGQRPEGAPSDRGPGEFKGYKRPAFNGGDSNSTAA